MASTLQAAHAIIFTALLFTSTSIEAQIDDVKKMTCDSWGELARIEYANYKALLQTESPEKAIAFIKDWSDYDYHHPNSSGRKRIDMIVAGLKSQTPITETKKSVIDLCMSLPEEALNFETEDISNIPID